jgi:hypothetical protein
VDKKVTNLQIAGKSQPTKTKGHPTGRVKNTPEAAHMTTSNEKYYCDYYNKDGHTKIDATRRKGTQEVQL